MAISTDVRKYGETVLGQGKQALDEARKPWYAAVGAGDLAYQVVQQQLSQLPAEVQARLRRLQAGTGELDATQLREAVGTAAGQAKQTYTAYANQAKEAYSSYAGQAKDTYVTYLGVAREQYQALAHRGELVVRRLRRSPEVREAFGKAEELISEAGQKVEQADEKVTKPGPARTAPRSSTARKAPAKRPATKA